MPDGAGRHSEAYGPRAVTHEVRTDLLTMRSCEDRTAKSGCPIPVIAWLYSEPQQGPDPMSALRGLSAREPTTGSACAQWLRRCRRPSGALMRRGEARYPPVRVACQWWVKVMARTSATTMAEADAVSPPPPCRQYAYTQAPTFRW